MKTVLSTVSIWESRLRTQDTYYEKKVFIKTQIKQNTSFSDAININLASFFYCIFRRNYASYRV